MMEDKGPDKEEKTEAATPKKISKQRADGNVFMSQELSTAIVIFLTAWILKFTGPWIFKHFYLIFLKSFKDMISFRATPENILNYVINLILFLIQMLAPTIALLVLAGSFATLVQTGWVVSWKKGHWKFSNLLKFKWSALAPDKKKFVDLFINIAKIGLVGSVAFFSLKGSIQDWLPLMDAPVINAWNFIFALAFKIVMRICFMLFILAAIDFFFKRKDFTDKLKMTKWEVKEERKQADGDPKIKAALRGRRFAFFRKLMMEAIPKADVIITNPTHFAVAIHYDLDTMEAPKVVAKGAGKLAEKIKEIAKKNDIPMIENKPLAQVLFKTVEVGSYIPVSLYKAVAEILAYVFRIKKDNAA